MTQTATPDLSQPADVQAGQAGPATCHVVWEPPNRGLASHLQTAGLYHAVPDQPIDGGTWIKEAGKVLCSWRGEPQEPPAALLAPAVTCTLCAHQISRLGLSVRES